MPGVRDFLEQFAQFFQSLGNMAAGMKGNKKKKEKKPQGFRGGGRGSVDLNNYNPKSHGKDALLGGSAAAVKSMQFSGGDNLKNKLKKKDPPKLQGRGNSGLSEKKVGVTPPSRLKRT